MISNENVGKKNISDIRDDYGKLLEAFVSYIYHRWVDAGDNAIDAGVNTGAHFFPLARIVGRNGCVIGFEANPLMVDKVLLRVKNENITNYQLHGKALHESKQDDIDFIVYPENPGLSHLNFKGYDKPVHKNLETEVIKVSSTSIDSFQYEKLSFIKMDLEGADYFALRGAQNTLATHHPLVMFELGYGNATSIYNYDQKEFFEYFESINYLIFDIHGNLATPKRWDMRQLTHEFFGIHRDDPKLLNLLIETARFWKSAKKWPHIQGWGECAMLGRKPPELVSL